MDKIKTKSGELAIIQVTQGGLVVAEEDGTFNIGVPFSLKNDGEDDAELVVRLAAQEVGETYPLLLRANSYFSEELIGDIISGIPATHSIKWGC
jgi:hypothetical protein